MVVLVFAVSYFAAVYLGQNLKLKLLSDRGVPQGGLIPCLLANIYLNILDSLWEARKVDERLGARLIRYADDLLVVCRGDADRVLKVIRMVMEGLGLSLNEAKTRIVDARKEGLTFLVLPSG